MPNAFYGTPVTAYDYYGTETDLLERIVDTEVRLAGKKTRWMQAITTKSGKSRTVPNRKFEWMKDTVSYGEYEVSSCGADGTTSDIVITAGGTGILYNTLLFNTRNNEIVRVNSVSTNTLTVQRNVGGARTSATISAGDVLLAMPPLYGEKSTIPAGIVKSPSMDYNYTQRFLYAIEITKDMWRAKSHFKNPRAYWHARLMEKHLVYEERLALFGQRAVGPPANTGNNAADVGASYLTGGLYYYVSTNVIDLSDQALDEELFRDQFEQIFDEGSEEKTLLCSRAAAERINSWGRNASSNYRIGVTDNKIGFKCDQYIGGSGVLNIAPTDILKHASTSAQFNGDNMIICETDEVTRMINEPMKLKMDAQNPEAISVIKDYYDAQYGWEWGVESYHSIIKNWH